MALRMPKFLGKSKKTSSGGSSSNLPSWQRSGQELRREGARKDAVTSIHNVSRKGSADEKRGSRAVSSVARAGQSETEGEVRRHAGFDSPEEAREADERRYEHIRRLIKEKKKSDAEAEKRKKRGLFF